MSIELHLIISTKLVFMQKRLKLVVAVGNYISPNLSCSSLVTIQKRQCFLITSDNKTIYVEPIEDIENTKTTWLKNYNEAVTVTVYILPSP